ncbi:M23 family metallopeptidase [Gracilimonas sp.]|uniref:M23 family metallopeptidase n=1 Tax=Gracilimonas sp. TaxID=1974203 RepID=UPI002872068F|nr:M23 family metallopeptidase [Gracilimonas sp.]
MSITFSNSRANSLLILVLACLCFGFQDSNSVEIRKVEREGKVILNAINTNIYPVTIEFEVDLDNMEANKSLPFTEILSPKSSKEIVELETVTKGEASGYKYRYRFYMGDIHAQHNSRFSYRLPIERGKSVRVLQGFGGDFSHTGDLRHSLDFDMQEGTPVYAARGGLVVDIEDSNTEGGPTEDFMDSANYVTIMHRDGTFADYAHLKYQGVEVRVGQNVRSGQVIGYSGNTGFSTGPHLHFVVKKAKRGGGFISIPIKFATKNGIQLLEEGENYIGY